MGMIPNIFLQSPEERRQYAQEGWYYAASAAADRGAFLAASRSAAKAALAEPGELQGLPANEETALSLQADIDDIARLSAAADSVFPVVAGQERYFGLRILREIFARHDSELNQAA